MILEEKREYYEKRLYDGFIIEDQCNSKGTNLVANIRQYERYESSILKWGDTTINQSYYISYLATELFLATKNNDITRKERSKHLLNLSLDAIERLDETANLYYGGEKKKDGFFIRDDVDYDVLEKFPEIKISDNDGTIHKISSDLRPGWNNPHLKEMSQDQVWHLLFSFFFVQHLLHDTEKEISDRVLNIADRILSYMRQCNWNIKNPVTEKPVYRGAKVLWFKYGFAASINNMLKHIDTNTKLRYKEENIINRLFYVFIRDTQRLFQRLNIFKTWNQKDISFMLFETMLNNASYKRFKELTIKRNRYEHLYLIKHLLNGTKPKKTTQQYYLALLNECPENGFFNETIKTGSLIKDRLISGYEWCFDNRLTRHESEHPETTTRATGRYNGIDFLLLLNLYKIVFGF